MNQKRDYEDKASSQMLQLILLANVLSTSIHYPHNFWKAELYPPIWPFFPNPLSYRIGIAVFWPLLTVLGYRGYSSYMSDTSNGVRDCIPLFAAYSLLGTSSLGHFLGGVPQVHWFFFTTIFTDFFAGAALVWWVWKVRGRFEQTG